jgi:hypothetical protein
VRASTGLLVWTVSVGLKVLTLLPIGWFKSGGPELGILSWGGCR